MADYEYKDLTAKQQKLIDGLMAGLPKAEAYRQAYPDTRIKDPSDQVNKMIANHQGNFPVFSRVYADMEAEAMERANQEAEKAIISREQLLKFFSDVVTGKEADTVLRFSGDGEQDLVETPPAMRDRIKAGELLGKYYGAFTDKLSVDAAIPVVIAGSDKLED